MNKYFSVALEGIQKRNGLIVLRFTGTTAGHYVSLRENTFCFKRVCVLTKPNKLFYSGQ